jgi:hypothetical protein
MGTGLSALGEKQVNFSVDGTTDGLAGTQADPAVTALSNGDFVVVYENPEAGNNIDLLAHFFDPNGNAIGPPAPSGFLNGVVGVDRTVDPAIHPSVAATSNGGFLVAYTDTAVTDNSIVVRRYDPTTGISAPFVVDAGAAPLHQPNVGPVDSPAIASFADGTSVIVWEFDYANSATDHDLYFAFLNSTANGFTHTTYTLAVSNNFEGEARVASSGNSAAIVYAVNPGTIGGGQDIVLRLYNSSATQTAAPSTIFGVGSGDIFSHPDVAALSDGRFVIVAQDDTTSALVASIYDPVTHAVTPLVDFSDAAGPGANPHVAAAPGGGFVVSLDNPDGDVTEVRFAPGEGTQSFRSFHFTTFDNGAANSFTAGVQDQNAIAANANGTVFFAWQDSGSNNPNSTDTDTRIEAQADRLQHLPPVDFDGDGETDILWRNDNGDLLVWGTQPGSSFTVNYGNVSTSYQVAGTGDFNGDGLADILWRATNGDALLWNSNGGIFFTTQDLGVVPTSYQIAGTADFNGDGRTDILWRNVNGDTVLWASNNSGGYTTSDLGVVPTGWQIAGTDDFNGDGKSDILWRNNNGDTVLWTSNNSGGYAVNDLGVVPTGWQIAGTGDFNGDGKADILWRNANGDTALWNSTSAGQFAVQDLGVVATSYQVAGVGDYNGDGKADILWRNANGDTVLWNSNGSSGFTTADLGVVSTSYKVQAA